MKLTDLNFLTRFKHLFDFNSHPASVSEDMRMKNLDPMLSEEQNSIIQSIKKMGLEFERKGNSNLFFRWRPKILSSTEKFLNDRHEILQRDIIYSPMDV